MNATHEAMVQREMARLETWLAVYVLESRRPGRRTRAMAHTLAHVPYTDASLRATRDGR